MKGFWKQTIPVVPWLVIASLLPNWLGEYWLHVMIIAYYYALLAASWCLLAGYAGQFSFAHAALSAVGAYTSALLVLHTGIPPGFGMLMGTVVAGGVGLGIAWLCLRLQGPYLALFTIAFSEILRIFFTAEYRWTRGNFGLSVPPLFGEESKYPYYFTILGLLTLSLLIMALVLHSRWGLFFRAIREEEEAAASVAVHVVRYKIFAFLLSSLFCGLAGGFYAHYTRLLTPNMLLLTEMGLIIAMTIIGGIESLAGAVTGAILVEIVSEYLREYGEWRLSLFGLILLLTLRFSQNGLLFPLYQRIALRHRYRGEGDARG